ncbi:unnamed protein product, partial [Prorocentrum cordatum]
MVRRKADVMDVFSGFVLRGVVQTEDIPNVLKAVDDTMHMEGCLVSHKAMAPDSAFGARTRILSNAGLAGEGGPRRTRARSFFLSRTQRDGLGQVCSTFSSSLMSNDIVPYSALLRGDRRKREELEERSRRAEAETKLAEAQAQREADYQQQMSAYDALHARLTASEQLNLILQE